MNSNKVPKYIQRITTEDQEATKVEDRFRFQYMGSYEFENGTLSSSLEKLKKVKRHMVIREIPLTSFGVEDQSVFFLGREDDFSLGCETIHKAIKADEDDLPYFSYPFKERLFLKDALNQKQKNSSYYRTDGWWAVHPKMQHYYKGQTPFLWFLEKEDADIFLEEIYPEKDRNHWKNKIITFLEGFLR